jgi:multidrug efflux system membrane fusion protein
MRRGDKKPEASTKREEVVPVSLAQVEQKDVPIEVQAIGNVEALNTVAVRALVSGELTKVYFQQGQDVKKGELLFTIDPRPYQEALAQAKAQLEKDSDAKNQAEKIVAKDEAQQKYAEAEAQRYADLFQKGIVSKEQADQYKTNAATFTATVQADEAAVRTTADAVKSDQAAINTAEVNLSYTEIRSPMDGRTGSLLVFQGNLVKANDTNPLININQITPINVTFSVPEKELPAIRNYRSQGSLKVEAIIPDNTEGPEAGELTFIENSVDIATGTIKLRATFPNAQRRLWPGQYVNVKLVLTTRPNALVVPTQAVQIGQSGSYVYVVKSDQTVESRTVTTGDELSGNTVIENGLTAGETIVTDGQLRLVPGAKITTKTDQPEGGKSKPGGGKSGNKKGQ